MKCTASAVFYCATYALLCKFSNGVKQGDKRHESTGTLNGFSTTVIILSLFVDKTRYLLFTFRAILKLNRTKWNKKITRKLLYLIVEWQGKPRNCPDINFELKNWLGKHDSLIASRSDNHFVLTLDVSNPVYLFIFCVESHRYECHRIKCLDKLWFSEF